MGVVLGIMKREMSVGDARISAERVIMDLLVNSALIAVEIY